MTEFDKYAQDYDQLHKASIKGSGYEPTFFDEYKIAEMCSRIGPDSEKALKILNFGCGIGKSEPFLTQYFPHATIVGADVSKESIDRGRIANAGLTSVSYVHYDEGGTLELDVRFDLVFIANVFHHIPHSQHPAVLQNLRRLMRIGGRIFMFEHNPFNPLTQRVVKMCEFDQDAVLLYPDYSLKIFSEAGFKDIHRRYTLFFPRILSALRSLEPSLHWLPLGAQYYIDAQA